MQSVCRWTPTPPRHLFYIDIFHMRFPTLSLANRSTMPYKNTTMQTKHLPILLLGIALSAGCATKKEPTPREPHGVFRVKVVPYFGKDVPVYLAAYTRGEDGNRSDKLASNKVGTDGVSGFALPMGKVYEVTGYADLNNDGNKTPDEPTATVTNLKPLSHLGSGPEYDPVVLRLPGEGVAPEAPRIKWEKSPPPPVVPKDSKGGSSAAPSSASPAPAAPTELPVPPPPPQ